MRAFGTLRRLVSAEVSIAALLEFAMWLAIPHLVIGMVFTFLQPQYAAAFEDQLAAALPVGAHLVAFGVSVLLWPTLLFAPQICGV